MRKKAIGIQHFIQHEAFSSIFLLVCAILAILWANSSFNETYFNILNTRFGLEYNGQEMAMPLIHWINDGLMSIFFFVIGLEIKREIMAGQLSSVKKATLPVIAALGGIVIPIAIFTIMNHGRPGSEGWGIPMATDIAFSLGILTLLGKRVPIALKVFLTAFAIFDDICAVVVIAIFYSTTLHWHFLLIAILLLALLFLLNRAKLYNGTVFLLVGIVIWFLFFEAGVHPTIAGVLIAFTIPANKKMIMNEFLISMKNMVYSKKIEENIGEHKFLCHEEIRYLEKVNGLTHDAMPTCQQLEKNLHGFVSYLIMPIFALANAGVIIWGGNQLESGGFNYFSMNIATSLVLGKVIGITGFTYLAVKFGLAELPKSIKMKHIFGLSFLGGFGFTMSLFINNLSISDNLLEDSAKLGILAGSLAAAVLGYTILKMMLPAPSKQ